MNMSLKRAAFVAVAASLIVAPVTIALAHGIAGDRFFPATIAVDDPAVADELSFPTFSYLRNGDGDREIDLSFEYSKRITDNLGLTFGETWTHLRPGGSGWQNLETSLKYQAITNAEHEFILSLGFTAEVGGTGAKRVGADEFTTVAPVLYFGKGFGDLPANLPWLRPFAITGQAAYQIPTVSKTVTNNGISDDTGLPDISIDHNPRSVAWGMTLQYSLPYLKANVMDIGLPDFFNHLIPLVEASLVTPVSNTFGQGTRTTGTVNPGVIWAGQKFQVGVEALLPINRESGRHAGVVAQIHFYLDDIFPDTIGRPLIRSAL